MPCYIPRRGKASLWNCIIHLGSQKIMSKAPKGRLLTQLQQFTPRQGGYACIGHAAAFLLFCACMCMYICDWCSESAMLQIRAMNGIQARNILSSVLLHCGVWCVVLCSVHGTSFVIKLQAVHTLGT